MLERLASKNPNVLGFRLTGTLLHGDSDQLLPLLRRQIDQQGGIRAVIDVTGLSSVEPRALWDEIQFDAKHAADVIRCAILGDRKWQEVVTNITAPMFTGDRVRFFPVEEADAAWEFAEGGDAVRVSIADEPIARSPEDVVASERLDHDAKAAALDDLSRDEAQLMIADDDGFQGGRPPDLQRIDAARRELETRRPIIVATDFSDDARRAYSPALELASRLGVEVRLVHVVPPSRVIPGPPVAGIPAAVPPALVDDAALTEDARRRMAQEVERLAQPTSPAIHGDVINGVSSSDALSDYAEKQDAELILIGSAAKSAFGRFLGGSTSEEVLHRCARPVLVVPPSNAAFLAARPHLGITIEGDESGGAPSIEPALDLARRLGAQVTLIHAIVPGAATPLADPATALDTRRERETAETATELLARVRASMLDLPVDTAVVEGPTIDEAVTTAARDRNVDVLCMVSHGHRGLSRLVFGGATEAVLRRAELPVVIFAGVRADQSTERAQKAETVADASEHEPLQRPGAVDRLNKLIRGEISAIETYVQALEGLGNEHAANTLERLKKEHIDATNLLRAQVHALHGVPSTASGPWGTFAKLAESAAQIFGDAAALRTLQEGEALGVRWYEDAIRADHMPSDTRRVIRETLLPRQRTHVETLRYLSSER